MWHVGEREEVLTGFWWGEMKEGDDLVDLSAEGCYKDHK